MTDFDLRHAFARHYFGMPKRPRRAFENDDVDDLNDTDDNAGGEGEGQEDDNDSEEHVDDPDKKRLSNEAAKYRRERNQWRKRAEDAELKVKISGELDTSGESAGTIKALRLELSFERLATKARISDIEAAWRLVEDDLKAVKVEDDQVDAERLQQIVDHVVERYPYLRDDYAPKGGSDSGSSDGDPSSSPSVQSGASGASGRPVNGRRQRNQNTDFGSLSKKFPALRR